MGSHHFDVRGGEVIGLYLLRELRLVGTCRYFSVPFFFPRYLYACDCAIVLSGLLPSLILSLLLSLLSSLFSHSLTHSLSLSLSHTLSHMLLSLPVLACRRPMQDGL